MFVIFALTWLLGALIGGALFMLLPVVKSTERIGHKYLWLCMFSVKRASFVLQQDGELNFKKLKYDPIGSEKVKIGSDVVTISDPARSLETFKNRTLALSDEIHGVVFRVSDALVGKRKRELHKKNTLVNVATDEERKNHEISVWIRKYVHIPVNTPVDLRDVRAIATGSEKGTDPWLVRLWYKFSRIRENDDISILKLMLVPAAFLATLIIFWQAGARGGSSGTAPTGNTTNGTELNLLLFVFAPYASTFKKAGIVATPLIVCFVAYALFGWIGVAFPVAFSFGIVSGFVGVMAFVLLISLLGAGAWLSTFFLDMALQCFDNPTFRETDDGYELYDGDGNSPKHKLGKHWLYFEVAPSGVAKRDGYVGTVNDIRDAKGQAIKSPSGGLDWFGYYIPSMTDASKHYITALDAFGSLAPGFIGKDSSKRHKKAKEEFGDGISDVSSKFIITATFAAIVLAVIVGWVLLL